MSKSVTREEVMEGLDAPKDEVNQKSAMERLIEGRQERERLARMEATQVLGAFELTPKAMLFEVKEAQAHPANKGKHLRWLNKSVAEKVQARLMEGYERVPADEGGRDLGAEFALFRIPEELAEKRRKRQEERQQVWLNAHNAEVEKQAEQIARILRDKYGFTADESKIIVRD